MADIATEAREAVVSPQKKEVEKKEVEETKVAENGSEEKELPKENGTNGNIKESEESSEVKETETTENGDSTDSTDATKAVKRKSDAAGGDAPDSVPEEGGASPEKKAKLEEKPAPVENGEAEAAVA